MRVKCQPTETSSSSPSSSSSSPSQSSKLQSRSCPFWPWFPKFPSINPWKKVHVLTVHKDKCKYIQLCECQWENESISILWIYLQLASVQLAGPAVLYNAPAAHVNVLEKKEKRLENGYQREAHENRQNVSNCAWKVWSVVHSWNNLPNTHWIFRTIHYSAIVCRDVRAALQRRLSARIYRNWTLSYCWRLTPAQLNSYRWAAHSSIYDIAHRCRRANIADSTAPPQPHVPSPRNELAPLAHCST